MPSSFVPAVTPSGGGIASDALAFAFRSRHLLVWDDLGAGVPAAADDACDAAAGEADVQPVRLPCLGDVDLDPIRHQFLGTLAGRPVVSLQLPDDAEAPDGMSFLGLRQLCGRLEEVHFDLAFRAVQIVAWDRDHQFCGRCGERTADQPDERAKQCPACGLASYPRLSPAVIVLIERGHEVLLARSPHFAPGVYSTLAGFVEPGETLEQAVVREIEEEVGVVVGDLRYFGSQPWPFPNSLMIGFKARYVSGEICCAEPEIEDAGWFTADNLPVLPSKISIARSLVEDYLARRPSASQPPARLS